MISSTNRSLVKTVYKGTKDCVYGSLVRRFTDPVATADWTAVIPLDFEFYGKWFICQNPSWYYWPNIEVFRQLLISVQGHFYSYMEINSISSNDYEMRLVVRTQTANDALIAKLSLDIDSYMLDQYK